MSVRRVELPLVTERPSISSDSFTPTHSVSDRFGHVRVPNKSPFDDGTPRHLAPSTYGPSTLSEFLEQEIQSATSSSVSSKGKGKEKADTLVCSSQSKAPKTSCSSGNGNASRATLTEADNAEFPGIEKAIKSPFWDGGNALGDFIVEPRQPTTRKLMHGALYNLRGMGQLTDQTATAPLTFVRNHKQTSDVGKTVSLRLKGTGRDKPASIISEPDSRDILPASLSVSVHTVEGSGDLRASSFTKHAKARRMSTRQSSKRDETHNDTTSSFVADEDTCRLRKTPDRAARLAQQKVMSFPENPSTILHTTRRCGSMSSSVTAEKKCTTSHAGENGASDSAMPGLNAGVNSTLSVSTRGSGTHTSAGGGDVPTQKLQIKASHTDKDTDQDSENLNTQVLTISQPPLFPYAHCYSTVVPEILPHIDLRKRARNVVRDMDNPVVNSKDYNGKQNAETGTTLVDRTVASPAQWKRPPSAGLQTPPLDSCLAGLMLERNWQFKPLPVSPNAPPVCPVTTNNPPRNSDLQGRPTNTDESCLPGFNHESWVSVASYLSSEDIRRARLVSKGFAYALAPIMMRSVVTKFGKSFFDLNVGEWDDKHGTPPRDSMLARYGSDINKFGISFEIDYMGLANAEPKIIEKEVHAWFGSYMWPVEKYPRYPALQTIEDLADHNRTLLKNEIAKLTGATELALSIDSGHGWVEGPDMSDLALFELRRIKNGKVFGKAFDVEDVWHTFGRNEYFMWAQQNTINETLKTLSYRNDSFANQQFVAEMEKVAVRPYESYKIQAEQFDKEPLLHVGGAAPCPTATPSDGPTHPAWTYHQSDSVMFQGPGGPVTSIHGWPMYSMSQDHQMHRVFQQYQSNPGRTTRGTHDANTRTIQPQFPLIFNCHSLTGTLGGCLEWIFDKTANPAMFPFLPGALTDAQAQWLVETLWAQRAFLSAYTTAIITNKARLQAIRVFHLSKFSSGLLPSLAQHEFWASLPGLKKLKILVSPDWRQDHIIGDRFHGTNMLIEPVLAAIKFAEFLRQYIARLEGLSHLTIGYAGGGEHAAGLFARNQHVLPAPIVENPRAWINPMVTTPAPSTMFKFDHIRDLTFENCWFSSSMLEAFMKKSRDTSLHTLTLDSVSMLTSHAPMTNINGPQTTITSRLKCEHSEDNYLLETIPSCATWVDAIDKITPGQTLQDRKYQEGIINRNAEPKPAKEFRGNVQRIFLKSCGHLKISGVGGDEFNQNFIVAHSIPAIDSGLTNRRQFFRREVDEVCTLPPVELSSRPALVQTAWQPVRNSKSIMMNEIDPATGQEWFGLGKLTQCIHPVEKRILERAWGMKFGWGDDMARWGSVEDGFYEGGTGRFSGFLGVDDDEEQA